MRSRIYQLHRRLSIIIAIPVLLWAASGFMHPLMTNIRPAVATREITAAPIDSHRIRISLHEALRLHHLDSIANFRFIHIDTNWFYQVQLPLPRLSMHGAEQSRAPLSAPIPIYLSCLNGKVLAAGDWLYAQYLARQFLEGQSSPRNAMVFDHSVAKNIHDCCGAATDCVLNPVKGAKVSNVSLLHDFNREYKSINRLLPVYQVSFERPDGIRIYVETTRDRFSFAMDNRRAFFDEVFRLFHTYGWLDSLGKGRLAIEAGLALLAFLTALLGIYIFFTTRTKPPKGNPMLKARRNHRYVSIIAALFTLLWTFSGCYHALSKFRDDDRGYFAMDNFSAMTATPDLAKLQTAPIPQPITNIGLVQMNGQAYWRISTSLAVSYLSTADYSVLPDGDALYAASLATRFSGRPDSAILSTTPVTAFGDEYNFTDKRLPVWKVSYAAHHHERYYVETSTGHLASRVDDQVAREGWSFSVFHKHHFMDWGGKTVRDASTMFWAFAQVAMVVVGLILWFRYRNR